jgi:hypothetical protein
VSEGGPRDYKGLNKPEDLARDKRDIMSRTRYITTGKCLTTFCRVLACRVVFYLAVVIGRV